MDTSEHTLDDRAILCIDQIEQVEKFGDIGADVRLMLEHLRCDRDVPADSHAIDTERAQLQIPQPIGLELHDVSRKNCAEHDGVSPLALERRVRRMRCPGSGLGVVANAVVRAVVVACVHRGERRVVAVLGEAVLVHLEHVVCVHEVFVQELPVGVPHVDLAMHRHITGHVVTTDDVAQHRKPRTELGRIWMLRDEQEPLPLFEPQPSEVVIGCVESVAAAIHRAIHVRSTDQLPVEPVDPRVVWTRDARLTAATLQQRRATMNTHVVEDGDRFVVISNRDDRPMDTGLCRVAGRDLGGEVVALVGNVGGAADAHPLPGEDSAMLLGEHIGRRVRSGRQHACLLERQPSVRGQLSPDGLATDGHRSPRLPSREVSTRTRSSRRPPAGQR